jgi:hypothetical protein
MRPVPLVATEPPTPNQSRFLRQSSQIFGNSRRNPRIVHTGRETAAFVSCASASGAEPATVGLLTHNAAFAYQKSVPSQTVRGYWFSATKASDQFRRQPIVCASSGME